MEHIQSNHAWEKMIKHDPTINNLISKFKVIIPPTVHCRCDVCGRVIQEDEMVWQDKERPVTICEQCYDPEADYHSMSVVNRINVLTLYEEH
jgi:hypothetical protein